MSAPPEEVEAEGRRWLRFATEDLDLAERDLEDARTVPRGACLHAQQAAEKSLEAALILLGIDPPAIHNLETLRRRLPDGWLAKSQPSDLSRLTALIIEARYPGEWPEPTRDDAREAVALASEILRAIRRDLEANGLLPAEIT